MPRLTKAQLKALFEAIDKEDEGRLAQILDNRVKLIPPMPDVSKAVPSTWSATVRAGGGAPAPVPPEPPPLEERPGHARHGRGEAPPGALEVPPPATSPKAGAAVIVFGSHRGVVLVAPEIVGGRYVVRLENGSEVVASPSDVGPA